MYRNLVDETLAKFEEVQTSLSFADENELSRRVRRIATRKAPVPNFAQAPLGHHPLRRILQVQLPEKVFQS